MKNNILRISFVLAALLVILAATSQAAAVISWNVDSYGTITGANQVAGVVPAPYWNDTWIENSNAINAYGPPTTVSNLIDNSGSATSLSVAYQAWGFWSVQGSAPGQDADGTYNRNLLNGYLNAGPASWGPPVTVSTVILSQIPYAQYDLYVYFNSDNGGPNNPGRTGNVSDGTTTYDFSAIGAASISGPNAVFTLTTDTTGANPSADYAVFSGLSGSSTTLVCTPLSGNDQWLGIAGVQVVQVPEPSTIILLSIAGLALLLVRRRS